MSEHPFFPVIQLRRVANGWVVSPSLRLDRDHISATLEETYVFSEWADCEAFMRKATISQRCPE